LCGYGVFVVGWCLYVFDVGVCLFLVFVEFCRVVIVGFYEFDGGCLAW